MVEKTTGTWVNPDQVYRPLKRGICLLGRGDFVSIIHLVTQTETITLCPHTR